jgi:FtsH-binding integral membrane protein
MRALILGLVIVAAAAALLFYSQPGGAQLGNQDVPRLIYMLLVLLLVFSGAVSLSRESKNAGGPGMLTSLLIWAAIFAVIVLLYRAGWFWSWLVAQFR